MEGTHNPPGRTSDMEMAVQTAEERVLGAKIEALQKELREIKGEKASQDKLILKLRTDNVMLAKSKNAEIHALKRQISLLEIKVKDGLQRCEQDRCVSGVSHRGPRLGWRGQDKP